MRFTVVVNELLPVEMLGEVFCPVPLSDALATFLLTELEHHFRELDHSLFLRAAISIQDVKACSLMQATVFCRVGPESSQV